MATITLKGNTINTLGKLPKKGSKASNFSLTSGDLSDKTLHDFLGKRIILNIFPSIDTGTCATSVRKFNEKVTSLENTVVLCISRDLPFAQGRFCGAEGIKNVIMLSEMKNTNFSDIYQVRIIDGPLEGLLSRSIIVIDTDGTILHTEQVSETTEEPNYQEAISVL